MRTGTAVLEYAVAIPREDDDLTGWVPIGQVALRVLGTVDGRTIYQSCRRLERGGLLEIARHGGRTDIRATQRGREVDAILARITHARGGTFAPWSLSGISSDESLSLR